MKGKRLTYNHSMQMTPTRSHLEGGSPPPSHESPLKILPRINYLNWLIHSVFNTLFHDLVTISNIPLYGFFHFPRSYLENIVFIYHDAFPHKSLPLSPTKILFPMDIYLPSIEAYLESHLEAYHERFISIPFLIGFGKHLLSLGAPPSKWFILLIYLIIHWIFILHIT